jgi:hypothetical protein
MPNQLSFEVEFTREQIEGILKDPGVASIVVTGNYLHVGGNIWDVAATAQGAGTDKSLINSQVSAKCIRPCP